MESVWTWLNGRPGADGIFTLVVVAYLVLFGAGFVLCAYLAGTGAEVERNPELLAGVRHWARVGLWIFGSGLFFVGIRALAISPMSFGEPIWLVACVVALIVAAVRCVGWWRSVNPARVAPGADGMPCRCLPPRHSNVT